MVLDDDRSIAKKRADEAEVLDGVLGGDRGGGDAEPAADRLGDRPGRHAALADGVQEAAGRGLLEPEADHAAPRRRRCTAAQPFEPSPT